MGYVAPWSPAVQEAQIHHLSGGRTASSPGPGCRSLRAATTRPRTCTAGSDGRSPAASPLPRTASPRRPGPWPSVRDAWDAPVAVTGEAAVRREDGDGPRTVPEVRESLVEWRGREPVHCLTSITARLCAPMHNLLGRLPCTAAVAPRSSSPPRSSPRPRSSPPAATTRIPVPRPSSAATGSRRPAGEPGERGTRRAAGGHHGRGAVRAGHRQNRRPHPGHPARHGPRPRPAPGREGRGRDRHPQGGPAPARRPGAAGGRREGAGGRPGCSSTASPPSGSTTTSASRSRPRSWPPRSAPTGHAGGQPTFWKALSEASKTLDVDLNPRYGNWDVEKSSRVDAKTPWLREVTSPQSRRRRSGYGVTATA